LRRSVVLLLLLLLLLLCLTDGQGGAIYCRLPSLPAQLCAALVLPELLKRPVNVHKCNASAAGS
jgi:hypothetical protein